LAALVGISGDTPRAGLSSARQKVPDKIPPGHHLPIALVKPMGYRLFGAAFLANRPELLDYKVVRRTYSNIHTWGTTIVKGQKAGRYPNKTPKWRLRWGKAKVQPKLDLCLALYWSG
jgi:hypothetical protein